MQSTLKPKLTDDPHDVLVVPSDLVRVVPGEEEVSSLLREAARQHSAPQPRIAPDRAAVPPVDTTFRAAAVDEARRPIGRGLWRGFTMLLLVACLGGAGVAWQAYGGTARALIATSVPDFLVSLLPAQKPDTSGQPAETETADAAPAPASSAQPAPPPQATPDAAVPAAAASPPIAAPSPDSAELQSMARDIASLTQQVEALKAGIDELKASQQQISRDVARAAVQTPKPKPAKLSAITPHQETRPRQPMPIYQPAYPPPQAQMAPPPQGAAPYPATAPYYAPRQAELPSAAAPQDDPEMSAAPRPPMPVR